MNESDTNGEHESVLYEVKNESKKFFDQKAGMRIRNCDCEFPLPGHFPADLIISLGLISMKCYARFKEKGGALIAICNDAIHYTSQFL